MTFDEAIDKSRVLSMDGTQQIYSDDVIGLINELRAEYAIKEPKPEPKYQYAIQRSIMSNSKSLQSLRDLLARGYKIIDKSILVPDSSNSGQYIEYVLAREIKSE